MSVVTADIIKIIYQKSSANFLENISGFLVVLRTSKMVESGIGGESPKVSMGMVAEVGGKY